MNFTAALLANTALEPRTGRLGEVLVYIGLGVVALIAAFLVFFVIVCLCEKQYLAGDVEQVQGPLPYPPSPYWIQTRERAARIGLWHAGDFATRKNTSLVKGLETLYFSSDHQVLASIVGGSSAIGKTKKTVLRTRLADGRILESTDSPINRDVTGGIKCAVLLNAGIEELLNFHRQRINSAGSSPVPFNGNAALDESERIQLGRGERLVAAQLANWANREQTCIRLTFRGAIAYVKDMFAHMGQLENQKMRIDIKRAG